MAIHCRTMSRRSPPRRATSRHALVPAATSTARRAALALGGLLLLLPATASADLGDRLGEALGRGSILAYALVFVGGVLTSLTPCVYPLIPITLSIFGARGERVSRGRAVALASVYVAGIGVMYTALGVGVALTGRAFGSFMGSPYVIVPIAVLFVIMAASMFGAFELHLPMGLQARLSQIGGAGWSGAFFMGLVGGIIAAPCTGPVLASLLAYVATTRSVLFGGSLLFTYALGMGLLFFVLAASAASLPKSGAWMEAVKSIFGVVMLLAADYFLRNVWRPIAELGDHVGGLLRIEPWRPAFALVAFALVAAGAALGAIHLSVHDDPVKKLRKGLGLVLVTVGGVLGIAWLLSARPLEWIQGAEAATARAKQEGRPLLLDFSADWCLPCKELEIQVFGEERVRRELDRFVTGKVDSTEDSDALDALKVRYRAATLPTVLLFDAQGREAARWTRVFTVDEFLAAAARVK